MKAFKDAMSTGGSSLIKELRETVEKYARKSDGFAEDRTNCAAIYGKIYWYATSCRQSQRPRSESNASVQWHQVWRHEDAWRKRKYNMSA